MSVGSNLVPPWVSPRVGNHGEYYLTMGYHALWEKPSDDSLLNTDRLAIQNSVFVIVALVIFGWFRKRVPARLPLPTATGAAEKDEA